MIWYVGKEVGMTQETVIDEKGRILISKEVRNSLGLKHGMRLKPHIESDRLIIEKSVSPDEFCANMKGFIKKGSEVPVSDPIKLKQIWK
ncbi:MAG: AbrB/MazE/SpoVT family DNA-binding domain-containing protein [Candidatus Thermoplasmatota archaeon]|nr:AbrB/MazE/SpoVT family DNA-binding domain-containing protein [Candidatus Thermoplasmatota archaeon]